MGPRHGTLSAFAAPKLTKATFAELQLTPTAPLNFPFSRQAPWIGKLGSANSEENFTPYIIYILAKKSIVHLLYS